MKNVHRMLIYVFKYCSEIETKWAIWEKKIIYIRNNQKFEPFHAIHLQTNFIILLHLYSNYLPPKIVL
jgi:hypothetical protein